MMFKSPVDRRGIVAAGMAAAMALALAPAAGAQTRLRVNYVPILDVTPMFVAIDKGYFAEGGLVASRKASATRTGKELEGKTG